MYQVHTVEFPKMGLDFNINPTAFSIGGFTIQWYGVIIAMGFLLAFLYLMFSCRKFNVDQDRLIDAVIVGMIGGIIGARLYYVIFYPGDQYVKEPLSILYIWNGGLAIYGGIIGGLLCGALMAKLRGLKIAAVLDLAALGFLIGQTVGRWGNYVNQEAFGTATDLPWGMISDRTRLIVDGPVHPCFLYESLWCLVGFGLLHLFATKLRRYDGQVFLLYLMWYGLGRFWIEGLRTDSLIAPVLNLRVSQLLAAATVLIALAFLAIFRNKTSLTGIGSPKVMALNGITLAAAEGAADDGKSTIFGDITPKPELEGSEETEEALAEEKTEEVLFEDIQSQASAEDAAAPEEADSAEETGSNETTPQEAGNATEIITEETPVQESADTHEE